MSWLKEQRALRSWLALLANVESRAAKSDVTAT